MSDQNYRAYFFANMYLPALHAGIQSQHTTAEMFMKYADFNKITLCDEDDYDYIDTLFTWAKEDKTTIVLNGGMSGDLQELVELFSSEDNPYPWEYFKETEYALNGALTNVGIILPEKVYAYDKMVQENKLHYENAQTGVVQDYKPRHKIEDLTEFEMRIVEALRDKRLMS